MGERDSATTVNYADHQLEENVRIRLDDAATKNLFREQFSNLGTNR